MDNSSDLHYQGGPVEFKCDPVSKVKTGSHLTDRFVQGIGSSVVALISDKATTELTS